MFVLHWRVNSQSFATLQVHGTPLDSSQWFSSAIGVSFCSPRKTNRWLICLFFKRGYYSLLAKFWGFFEPKLEPPSNQAVQQDGIEASIRSFADLRYPFGVGTQKWLGRVAMNNHPWQSFLELLNSIGCDKCNLLNFSETNIAPENGWLEEEPFLLGWSNLGGAMVVSFRAGDIYDRIQDPLVQEPRNLQRRKAFFLVSGCVSRWCTPPPPGEKKNWWCMTL